MATDTASRARKAAKEAAQAATGASGRKATDRDVPVESSGSRLIGLVLLGALFMMFWDYAALWPLKILVVLFHEMSHGLAAVLTGGSIESITLSPNEGGLCLTRGGWPFLVLNAGYLGSLLWGVLLLRLSRTPRSAARIVGGLAALLAVVTALYVRPILGFGFPFALLLSAGLAVFARALPSGAPHLLRALGVFSVLYALHDVLVDVLTLRGAAGITDATLLALATGIPAILWGLAWLAAGLGTLFAVRRWV